MENVRKIFAGIVFFIAIQNMSMGMAYANSMDIPPATGEDKGSEEDGSPPQNKWSWLRPDSIVYQTAGFVGFVAAGPNWKITDSNELTLLIGYLPESVGGVEIWHATLKLKI